MDRQKHINYNRPIIRKVYLNAGALVIKDEKALLVQEADDPFRGKWNFPLGEMKPDESLADAAIREVYEETGYHIKLASFLGIYQSLTMPDRNVIIVMFKAQLVGGKLNPDSRDLIQAKWLTQDEVNRIPDQDLMHIEMRNIVQQTFANPDQKQTFTLLE